MDVSRLFSPKSIAIIGGGDWGASMLERCRALGFQGDIWPVHPQGKPLAGVPAFRSIAQLPKAPDAAYICVNRKVTVQAVAELAEIGAGGAVCFASGFTEASAEDDQGAALQQQLLAAAGDMPILGPNCYGFINYLDRVSLWPDQHGGVGVDSGVALLTQSSNIAINLTMTGSGLPVSHVFTVGNQAQLNLADIAAGVIKDPRVKAIGMYVEGIASVRGFEALATLAHEQGKPVVVLKVGRSEQAQQATVSHTASLAGNHAAAAAFFKRLGFAQVNDLAEFIEALKLAYVCPSLPNNHISSMSCSGGEASLMADVAEDTGVVFPPLREAVRQDLRAALGPLVALANPLDYHTYIWRDTAKMTAVYAAMAGGDHSMNLLVLDFPRTDRCDDEAWAEAADCLIAARKQTGANYGVLASLGDNMPENHARHLLDNGVVPFCGMTAALKAIAALSACGMHDKQPVFCPPACGQNQRYEEAQAKALLKAAGLNVPPSRQVSSADEVTDAFETLTTPLVLKGMGLAHKTEAGAVALNLQSVEAVQAAMSAMDGNEFLLEEMVRDVVAELIIGVTFDPSIGATLTIGAGGVLTEVLKDTATLLLPTTEAALIDALAQLKIAPVLQGYRGQPAADQAAIVDAVMRLQAFVMERPGQIQEIEINPLLAGQHKATVADALIIGGLK